MQQRHAAVQMVFLSLVYQDLRASTQLLTSLDVSVRVASWIYRLKDAYQVSLYLFRLQCWKCGLSGFVY